MNKKALLEDAREHDFTIKALGYKDLDPDSF